MLDIQPGDLLSKPHQAMSPSVEADKPESEPVEEVISAEKSQRDLSPIFTPYTRAQFMLSDEEIIPLPPPAADASKAVPPDLQAVLAPSPEESIRQDWRRVLSGQRIITARAGQSSMPSILEMFGMNRKSWRDLGSLIPFGRTEKLDQQDAMSRVMFLVREADADTTKGALEDALEHYYEALELYPQMSYANQQAGRLLLILRRHQESIKFFEAALSSATEFGELLNDLGVANFYAGQTEKALENFEAALQAEPKAQDPMFNIGLVYQRMGRMDDARRQFETCIRSAPDDARAYRELAILEALANDRDSALYRLQQAITVDPAWPQPVLDAALLHAEEGNEERALGLLDVALEIAPVRVVYQVYQQPAFRPAQLTPGGKLFEERLARKAREQMRVTTGGS
ncbi:MAG: tetratricopeptide repeat protein [Kiritimatiellia bacterium]